MNEEGKEVAKILSQKIKDIRTAEELASQLLSGALSGLEVRTEDPSSFKTWLEQRLQYQLTWLDKEDYARALIRALWLAPRFAATDFGGARQRDFAQLWTDTARGFLGEIALQRFLSEKLGFEIELDVRRGNLEEFLPSDIKVRDPRSGQFRAPKKNVSIKTAKFNARWLDLPGAQFEHSDVFVLVKIGISRLHFSAFLKEISFLRDKLFAMARNLGELDNEQANKLWEETPDFIPIPAYVAGYIEKQELQMPVHQINCHVRGRKNRRITITHGVGIFCLRNVRQHPEVMRVDPTGSLPVEVEPIISLLSESKHFLAHSGALKFGAEAWSSLVKSL